MALLKKDVVESFGELSRRVIDILPEIVPSREEDVEVLEKWKAYYTAKKIPWAVARTVSRDRHRILTLWISA